jgi:hypothetical protein
MRLQALAVALSLLLDVLVVVEGDHPCGLRRTRHGRPTCLRTSCR